MDIKAMFEKAASYLYEGKYSQNDMITVLSTITSLISNNDRQVTLDKIQKISKMVEDDKFSIDKLNDIVSTVKKDKKSGSGLEFAIKTMKGC